MGAMASMGSVAGSLGQTGQGMGAAGQGGIVSTKKPGTLAEHVGKLMTRPSGGLAGPLGAGLKGGGLFGLLGKGMMRRPMAGGPLTAQGAMGAQGGVSTVAKIASPFLQKMGSQAPGNSELPPGMQQMPGMQPLPKQTYE